MNGTMPATVNSSDGSGEISEALGTTVCPRWAKCSRKRRRISAVCIRVYSVLRGRSRSGLLGRRRRSGVGCVGGVRAATPGQLRPGRRWAAARPGRCPRAAPPPGRRRRRGRRRRSRRSRRRGRAGPRRASRPMPCGVSFSAARESLRTTRAPIVMPMASQNSRRIRRPSARRDGRGGPSLSRAAASASGLALALLLRRGAHAVAERGDLDQRAAQRGGDDAGQGGDVARDVGGVAGDVVDPLEVAVHVRDRRGRLAEDRRGSARAPAGWSASSRRACARA